MTGFKDKYFWNVSRLIVQNNQLFCENYRETFSDLSIVMLQITFLIDSINSPIVRFLV